MNEFKKSALLLKILYIVTPLLMVFTTVVLIYAWYTNTLRTGEIDATTKNFAIEYTFDDDTEKNVSTYTVKNLAFFDYDATEESQFLEGEAVSLLINLKNTSDSDLNYTITFKATKTVVTGTNPETSAIEVQSVAYVGALLDFTGVGTTYDSIKARYDADTENTNYTGVDYDATDASNTNTLEVKTTGTITSGVTDDLTLYLFGIQEIDGATNPQFIYNGTNLRSYTFELTIYAEPISNSTVEENND